MPIPPFTGDVPSRDDPANFSERAEALFAWLVNQMVPGANTLEASLTMVGSTGTSSTSLTVGTGTKNLVTQAEKNWITASYVYLVDAVSVGNAMLGQVVSYDAGTGDLEVNVVSTTGSGTHAAWIIGLSVPMFPVQGSQLAAGSVAANLGYTPADAAAVSSALAGKAALAGSASQTFSVAAPAAPEHAVRLGQFSKTSGGYASPGGIVECWGYVSVGDVSSLTSGAVTFPSAFPAACRHVSITPKTQSGQNPVNFIVSVVDAPSASGFNWVAQELNTVSTPGAGFYWRAIGD